MSQPFSFTHLDLMVHEGLDAFYVIHKPTGEEKCLGDGVDVYGFNVGTHGFYEALKNDLRCNYSEWIAVHFPELTNETPKVELPRASSANLFIRNVDIKLLAKQQESLIQAMTLLKDAAQPIPEHLEGLENLVSNMLQIADDLAEEPLSIEPDSADECGNDFVMRGNSAWIETADGELVVYLCDGLHGLTVEVSPHDDIENPMGVLFASYDEAYHRNMAAGRAGHGD